MPARSLTTTRAALTSRPARAARMPSAARARGSRPDVLSVGRAIPLFQPGGPGNASRAVGGAAEPAIFEVHPDHDVIPLGQVPGEVAVPSRCWARPHVATWNRCTRTASLGRSWRQELPPDENG